MEWNGNEATQNYSTCTVHEKLSRGVAPYSMALLASATRSRIFASVSVLRARRRCSCHIIFIIIAQVGPVRSGGTEHVPYSIVIVRRMLCTCALLFAARTTLLPPVIIRKLMREKSRSRNEKGKEGKRREEKRGKEKIEGISKEN